MRRWDCSPIRPALLSRLLAGCAAILISAGSLRADDLPDADVTAALHTAESARREADAALAHAARLLAEVSPPDWLATARREPLPPDLAALIAASDADDEITTGSITPPAIRLPQSLVFPPAQAAAEPEPAPEIAAGELFDPAVLLRPSVPATPVEDLALARQALVEYRRGNLPLGDGFAERIADAGARAAMEWSAIRLKKQAVGFDRILRFRADYPEFPMAAWLDNRAEDALFVEKKPLETTFALFAEREPGTAAGRIALARAMAARGESAAANDLAREAYRDGKTNAAIRAAIARDFPGAVTPKDQRYLAERLIYDGATSEGLSVAATASPAVKQLTALLAASVNETGGAAALLARLDPALAKEPAALFARAQHLRRTKAIAEAARVLLTAPNDAEAIVDGDEWWIERRMLARKLLDAGDAATAYRITAAHHAESPAMRVDAEVHAGWIALRFLNQPQIAAGHFDAARAAARTPASIARADYWRGRAADETGDPMGAFAYLSASSHRHTFYGQLALARTGNAQLPEDRAALDVTALETATRQISLRAIRALLDLDARDLAQPLIADAAKTARHLEATVALGDLVARYGLPRLTVLAGKMALQQGLKAEEHAFPVFGIPPYDGDPISAEAAIVYSIARQESEFDGKAISHAGARGLMQLMPATARRTASRFKIPFDVNALTANPALNARIGAAHLGELLGEYRGSYLLSFAAYNAGGGRVKDWITAYGDPRNPDIDTIDWIERIPITETRHYVQKVFENLQIYRARLTSDRNLGIASDLKRGAHPRRDPAQRIAVTVPPVGAPDIR